MTIDRAGMTEDEALDVDFDLGDEEDAPAGAEGPSTAAFAAKLGAEDGDDLVEEEDLEDPDAAPTADEDDEAPEEASLAEDEADEDEDDEDAPETASVIDPPNSWGKEDAETWAKLPPEIQERIVARETDRDKSTSKAVSEAGQQRKVAEQAAQRLASYSDQAEQAITRIATTYQQYGYEQMTPQDWAELARENPEQYTQHKANAEKLQADFQEAQQIKANAEMARIENAAKQTQETLEQHFPEVHAARGDVAKYLVDTYQIDPTGLKALTPLDFVMTHKAMLWDKAQADSKARASSPKPSRQAPKRGKASTTQATSSSSRKASKARAQFMRTRSMEDAINALPDDIL